MRLLEYEAKEILGDFDFLVPPGAVIRTPQALEASLQQFGPRVAVKAQVRQDGRGKAGGVVLADSPADARDGSSDCSISRFAVSLCEASS